MNNSDKIRLITLGQLAELSISFWPNGKVHILSHDFDTARSAAHFLIPRARHNRSMAEGRAERNAERRGMGIS